MNSDWGLMGGYPSATGYRFEAHKTGLKGASRPATTLPLGGDIDPTNPDYERPDATAVVKLRDKQCVTTEDCYDNHDLYLNYLRGGLVSAIPSTTASPAHREGPQREVLPRSMRRRSMARSSARDDKGVFSVDEGKIKARCAEIRKERPARALLTREWMKEEQEQSSLNSTPRCRSSTCSPPASRCRRSFTKEFKAFWSPPADLAAAGRRARCADLRVPSTAWIFR